MCTVHILPALISNICELTYKLCRPVESLEGMPELVPEVHTSTPQHPPPRSPPALPQELTLLPKKRGRGRPRKASPASQSFYKDSMEVK